MEKLKTILLVDDSNSSNQYNRVLLEEMGVAENIVLKNSGEAALDFLKGEDTEGIPPQPELILLDIAMPQMDGFMFMDEYSKLPSDVTNSMQIVISILSDFLDVENFEKSKIYKPIGLLEQIKKPIDKEDVINIMEECFDQ